MVNRYQKGLAALMAASAFAFFPLSASASSYESLGTPVTGDSEQAEEYEQNPFQAASSGVEVQFKYAPHETYQIYCQDGFVTDLKFKPGEQVTYVGAGDTTRWVIDRSAAGAGALRQEHVYIKPVKRGLSTNIVINTNQRTYQIHAISGSRYNPMVSWLVETDKELLWRQVREREIENMMTVNAKELHIHYKVSPGSRRWAPDSVFDDGQKTFLKMKPEIRTGVAPVFMIEENGKTVLVNYRIVGNYYIIDRIFDYGKLMVGTDKVEIKRR